MTGIEVDVPITEGAVVKLRSGGPAMTVEQKGLDDSWWCVWFSAAGKARERCFPAAALRARTLMIDETGRVGEIP